jgi:hypothetical protein
MTTRKLKNYLFKKLWVIVCEKNINLREEIDFLIMAASDLQNRSVTQNFYALLVDIFNIILLGLLNFYIFYYLKDVGACVQNRESTFLAGSQ